MGWLGFGLVECAGRERGKGPILSVGRNTPYIAERQTSVFLRGLDQLDVGERFFFAAGS